MICFMWGHITLLYSFLCGFTPRCENSVNFFSYVSFALLLQKLGWFEAFRFVTFFPKHFYTSSFKLDYLYLFKFRLFTSVIGLRNSFWKVEKIVVFYHQRLTTTANDINKVLKIFNVFLLTYALFHLKMEIIGGHKCMVWLKTLQSDWMIHILPWVKTTGYKYQFLFCAEQISNQKMKSFVFLFFLINLQTCLLHSLLIVFLFLHAKVHQLLYPLHCLTHQQEQTFHQISQYVCKRLLSSIRKPRQHDNFLHINKYNSLVVSPFPILFFTISFSCFDCCFDMKIKINTINKCWFSIFFPF